MSDLDPTYRKGFVGGKLLGGEASLAQEQAARDAAGIQSDAQMAALQAIRDAGGQATETLAPLTQQALASRTEMAALLGLAGPTQYEEVTTDYAGPDLLAEVGGKVNQALAGDLAELNKIPKGKQFRMTRQKKEREIAEKRTALTNQFTQEAKDIMATPVTERVAIEQTPEQIAERQTAAIDKLLTDPAFQAQQATANRALERRASAYGGLVSGDTLSKLSEQNQLMAQQAIDRRLQQLGGFSQAGIGALSQTAGIQQGLGSAAAQALTGAAGAQAQGLLGAAQAKGQFGMAIPSLLGTLGGSALGGYFSNPNTFGGS